MPAVITKTFVVATELVIPTGIPTKETKVEIKTRPLIVDVKNVKCSLEVKIFCASYLPIIFLYFC